MPLRHSISGPPTSRFGVDGVVVVGVGEDVVGGDAGRGGVDAVFGVVGESGGLELLAHVHGFRPFLPDESRRARIEEEPDEDGGEADEDEDPEDVDAAAG